MGIVSAPVQLFKQLHQEWQEALSFHRELINQIDSYLQSRQTSPPQRQIFRALANPISHTRVVIFGQDPYPTIGHAHGLAFSVEQSVDPTPASLKNIFRELKSDVGIVRTNGNLSDWESQGVMLLNRILSTDCGHSLAHKKLGWEEITTAVAATLGERGAVAVLWGRSAYELRGHFRENLVITSAHPSPLSAYRGFFGSRPFSQVNEKLSEMNLLEITW